MAYVDPITGWRFEQSMLQSFFFVPNTGTMLDNTGNHIPFNLSTDCNVLLDSEITGETPVYQGSVRVSMPHGQFYCDTACPEFHTGAGLNPSPDTFYNTTYTDFTQPSLADWQSVASSCCMDTHSANMLGTIGSADQYFGFNDCACIPGQTPSTEGCYFPDYSYYNFLDENSQWFISEDDSYNPTIDTGQYWKNQYIADCFSTSTSSSTGCVIGAFYNDVNIGWRDTNDVSPHFYDIPLMISDGSMSTQNYPQIGSTPNIQFKIYHSGTVYDFIPNPCNTHEGEYFSTTCPLTNNGINTLYQNTMYGCDSYLFGSQIVSEDYCTLDDFGFPVIGNSCISTVTLDYNLVSGNQLISFPLELEDSTPTTIFTNHSDEILTLQGEGLATTQAPPNSGNWVGSLIEVNPVSGYWIDVSQPTTLSVTGTLIGNPVYTLHSGHNLISFPGKISIPVNQAIGQEYEGIIVGILAEAEATIYHEELGWLGSLETFKPTKAYWVNVQSEFDINFQFNGVIL